MTKRPVLVLGSEPRIVVAVARSLGRRGIPVDVAALNAEAPPVSSKFVRAFTRLADGSRKLTEELSDLIRDSQADMLIPTDDTALTLVAEHYAELKGLLHVGCPPPEVVRSVLDKERTLEVARACGIEVPLTYLVPDAAALQSLKGTTRFPLVCKIRSKTEMGESDFKIRYFRSFEELAEAFKADPHFGALNLLQEFCPGEDVGVGMIMRGGGPLAPFQHRGLKELPFRGGVNVLAVSEPLDPLLMEISVTLLRALRWEGVAMVEFRYDAASKRAVLMEANGRYWGSFPFAVTLGLDLPFYEWQLAHGSEPEIPSGYEAGARWRWTAGYLRRLHGLFTDRADDGLPRPSVRKELADVPRDFKPSVHDALWTKEDRAPALSELRGALKEMAVSDVKGAARKIFPGKILKHLRASRGEDSRRRSA